MYHALAMTNAWIGIDPTSLRISSTFEWDLSRDIEFSIDTDSYVGLQETDDRTHTIEAKLSIDVVSDFTIDFRLIVDRNNNPQRTTSGETPDQDDVRFVVGLGWEF